MSLKLHYDYIAQTLTEAMEDESTFERADACYTAVFRAGVPASVSVVMAKAAEEYVEYGEVLFLGQFLFEHNLPETLGLNDLIAYTVNYKGEGTGWLTWEEAKNLPLFKSKDESFFLFGA